MSVILRLASVFFVLHYFDFGLVDMVLMDLLLLDYDRTGRELGQRPNNDVDSYACVEVKCVSVAIRFFKILFLMLVAVVVLVLMLVLNRDRRLHRRCTGPHNRRIPSRIMQRSHP